MFRKNALRIALRYINRKKAYIQTLKKRTPRHTTQPKKASLGEELAKVT
jgi:hypothetical protein